MENLGDRIAADSCRRSILRIALASAILLESISVYGGVMEYRDHRSSEKGEAHLQEVIGDSLAAKFVNDLTWPGRQLGYAIAKQYYGDK